MTEPLTLDLRGTPCPINYVKAKLALEKMAPGEVLVAIVDRGEPVENVPRSVAEDGNAVTKTEPFEGAFKLWIQRGSDEFKNE